jgi:hypothetical protein
MLYLGLYDSDTGESLRVEKEVDVTAERDSVEPAYLLYTTAKRGRIVQLQMDCARIHYFLDEAGGTRMIREDSERFGFGDRLPALVTANAPTQ